jgi:23S rRNA G2445 N2-methylase RlmL
VIARVLSEREFLRTQLRDALQERVARIRPRWRPEDPAEMELWALETTGGWLSGLRLGRREARAVERPGALRPSVAAAMVGLAGTGRRLLDPFCGSGTIVAAATEDGWSAHGSDVDRSALAVARANTRAPLVVADATSPPFADGTFDAVVSNLPFGKQFAFDGSLEDALGALRALLSAGGCLVVLTARDASISDAFAIERRMDVELLGQPATLWKLRPDG